MLKSIIIDDEKKDRENLSMLLEAYCPQVEVIAEAWDKPSILKVLEENTPDLVFLDVQLGTLRVFDILKELETIDFRIVFVSAYDKYAIQGYQYDAIDYILKPIDPQKLIKVVDKIIRLEASSNSKETIFDDFKQFFNQVVEAPKISVTDTKGVRMIKIQNIIYCQSNGSYTTIMMSHKDEIVVSKNLKHFEEKLQNYNFFRVHKSYLINLDHVDLLVKDQGGSVKMTDGKFLPISRTSKKELFDKMNTD